MDLDFDLDDVQDVEFLVVVGNRKEPDLHYVHVEPDVKQELIAIAGATWLAMKLVQEEPVQYDPANDYPAASFIFLPLSDDRVARLRHIHDYGNARLLSNPLEMFSRITLYCARMTNSDGRRLVGVKQTSGMGRRLNKPRRVRLMPSGLELAEEPEFQLTSEYDFLIDSANVYVLRHSAFEGAARLEAAIREAAQENLGHLRCQMGYVDFSNLEAIASGKLRPARMLASIRAGNLAATFSQDYLIRHCDKHNIGYELVGGKLVIDPEDGLEFLKVVARYYTRFQPSEDLDELYYSTSRTKVG